MKVFNKNNFMIHSLVPKLSTKPSLAGLHITGDFTEVTNGHYAIRVYCKDGGSEVPETENLKPSEEKIDTLISIEAAKEIERAIPQNHHIPILNSAWLGKNTNKEQVEFICTDLETWRPIVTRKILPGGKFPDVEAAMPKEKPEIEIGFDAEYMEKLCQQFKKAKIKTIKMSICRDIDAIKLEGEKKDEKQKIMALLMPVKIE